MIKRFNVHEEIVKRVVPFGNGSIVFTPKKWIGQTVRVILEQEPINIKEDVLKTLQPFLEQVEGIYLFGSFARNEQEIDSDIDVLVIASKKSRKVCATTFLSFSFRASLSAPIFFANHSEKVFSSRPLALMWA